MVSISNSSCFNVKLKLLFFTFTSYLVTICVYLYPVSISPFISLTNQARLFHSNFTQGDTIGYLPTEVYDLRDPQPKTVLRRGDK